MKSCVSHWSLVDWGGEGNSDQLFSEALAHGMDMANIPSYGSLSPSHCQAALTCYHTGSRSPLGYIGLSLKRAEKRSWIQCGQEVIIARRQKMLGFIKQNENNHHGEMSFQEINLLERGRGKMMRLPQAAHSSSAVKLLLFLWQAGFPIMLCAVSLT